MSESCGCVGSYIRCSLLITLTCRLLGARSTRTVRVRDDTLECRLFVNFFSSNCPTCFACKSSGNVSVVTERIDE